MLKVALIGYGGIAQSGHIPGYANLEKKGKAKLVAAFDIEKDSFTKSLAINIGSSQDIDLGIRTYTDLEEMLAKEEIDLIDICVPTPFHRGYVVDMLNRGYHVLCEKPMSRTYEDCKAMVEAAQNAKGKLMIAQCVRFFPEYACLKEIVASGQYGNPKAAQFRRLSGPPLWGWNSWYCKEEMSGGALFDMHIHDVDVARYIFGEPEAVSCVTKDFYTGADCVHTNLYYDDFEVTAIGDWSLEGMPFKADYIVALEKATIAADAGVVTVYPRNGGEAYQPELSTTSAYEAEIEFFVDTITSGAKNEKNPPESAALSLKLVETLSASAKKKGEKIPFTV